MKRLLLIATLLTLPFSAIAAKPKAFACFSPMDTEKASPITLIQGTPQIPSAVFLSADAVIPSHFKLNGLVRHWYFGCYTRECDFVFKLNADGSGYYYDFSNSEKSTPSMTFACQSTRIPKEVYNELTMQ